MYAEARTVDGTAYPSDTRRVSVMTATPQEPNTGQAQEGKETSGHPAWKDILEPIPEDFRPLITPKLEEWDKGVQQKLQDARKPYEGYQQFVDNGVDPQELRNALVFAQRLENDPQHTLKLMVDHFKDKLDLAALGLVADSQSDDEDDDDDDFTDPEILRLKRELDEVRGTVNQREQTWQEQEQSRQQAEFDRMLDDHLADLRTRFGDYDEDVVLSYMARDIPGEEAVKQFQSRYPNYVAPQVQAVVVDTPPANAPVVMGAGGTSGVGTPPGAKPNPASWNKNETDAEAIALIKAMQSESS